MVRNVPFLRCRISPHTTTTSSGGLLERQGDFLLCHDNHWNTYHFKNWSVRQVYVCVKWRTAFKNVSGEFCPEAGLWAALSLLPAVKSVDTSCPEKIDWWGRVGGSCKYSFFRVEMPQGSCVTLIQRSLDGPSLTAARLWRDKGILDIV